MSFKEELKDIIGEKWALYAKAGNSEGMTLCEKLLQVILEK